MEGCMIELTVPSAHYMMLVIRLTTSGVLARSGLTVDAMEDVKMAAEEACNCLMRSSGCARIHVRYLLEAERFRLHAEAAGCENCANVVSPDEIDVIRCVLMSMVDDVQLTYEGRRLRGVELVKRLPSADTTHDGKQ